MPREFAIVLASIILFVKPAEADFAAEVFGSDPFRTKEFLFTVKGQPVEPDSMTKILSETYSEFGLDIHISDMRFVVHLSVFMD